MSSISCGWMPKREAVSRSIVSVSVVPWLCWSVATSRSSGSVCSFVEDLRRPVVELGEVGVLQRELELRARRPAADADVLRGLQNSRAPSTLSSFGRSRAMICCALALRSSRGFSVMKMRPLLPARPLPPIAIATAGDVGIGLHDLAERLLLALHVGERDVLRWLPRSPVIRPVSCCGKKPFGITTNR